MDPAALLPPSKRKGRKNSALLNPGNPVEKDEQKAVAEYLDDRPDMDEKWCHVANERQASPARRAELAAQGVKKGIPDILIMRRFELEGVWYGGLAIEMKRRKATPCHLDKYQDIRLRKLREEGWYAWVCKGSDEAIWLIERCFGPEGGGSGGEVQLREVEGADSAREDSLWAHTICG